MFLFVTGKFQVPKFVGVFQDHSIYSTILHIVYFTLTIILLANCKAAAVRAKFNPVNRVIEFVLMNHCFTE